MSRALGVEEGIGRYFDFSRGAVTGELEKMTRPRHVRRSDNLRGWPLRSMGSIRGGYREIQNSPLDDEPTTLARFVPTVGTNRLIVHTKDAGVVGGGKLFSITPAVPGRTQLTAPAGYTITDKDLSKATINNALYLAAQSDTQKPIMFTRYADGTYALDNMLLTVPPDTCTAAIAAAADGVNEGYHWWRIRFVYRNGSSKVGPVFPIGGLNVTAGNRQVNIGNLIVGAGNAAAKAKQDWVGWTLERTKIAVITNLQYSGALGSTAVPTANAPWYVVEELGTANTTIDIRRDSDLFYAVDEGLHLDPIHFEGLVTHKDRLWGWAGAKFYASQAVGDAEGTGPNNWDPDWEFPIPDAAPGDTIQSIVSDSGRLVIHLTRSIHIAEGDTPEDLRIFKIADGMGACGPRAVAVVGGVVYAMGDDGMSACIGTTARAWGDIEARDYLLEINPSQRTKIKAFNYAGDLLLFGYAALDSSFNNQAIIFDFKLRQFRHDTNFHLRDAVLQEDNSGDFGGVTAIFIDEQRTTPTTTLTDNPSFTAWSDARVTPQQVYAQQVGNALGAPGWTANGVLVSAQTIANQAEVDVCSDGGTGCIIAAIENRGGGALFVYAQRLDAAGNKLWNAGTGVQVSTTGSTAVRICADDVGGCYIAWIGNGNQRARITRLTSAGLVSPGWPASDGVALTGGTTDNSPSRPIIDGSGSVYIGWHAGGTAARLQKLSAGGVIQWVADGVVLGANTTVLRGMTICIDRLGGALALVAPTTTSLFVKHVGVAGTVTSTSANLEAVLTFPTPQACLPDGAGGCYAVWAAGTAGLGKVRARRVGSTGTLLWAGVVDLSAVLGTSTSLQLEAVSDGVGGFIAAWNENAGTSVTAQRVDGVAGALAWAVGGVVVRTSATGGLASGTRASTDGGSGAVVVWSDFRGAAADIYVQRLDPSGSFHWPTNGVVIGGATGAQTFPVIAFTGAASGGFPAAGVAVYHLWGFYNGNRDAVLADGTGGGLIPLRVVTPFYDDGAPEMFKSLQRLNLAADFGGQPVTVILTIDAGEGGIRQFATTIETDSFGKEWGDDTVPIGADDLVWASDDGSVGGEWAGDENAFLPPVGFPLGTRAISYALEITSAVEQAQIDGFVMDGALEPERSLS